MTDPAKPVKRNSLVRSGMIVSLLLFFAKLTGLARDAGLAAVFGTGVDLQAYAVGMLASAFVVGAMMVTSLSGTLVPAYNAAKQEGGEGQAFAEWMARGKPLFLFFLCVGALAYFLAPQTTQLLGPGLSPEAASLAEQLARGFALCIPVSFVAGWFAALLHANRRFVEVGLRSACVNLSLIVGMALLAPQLGAWSLWAGTLLGNSIEVLMQLPFVYRQWRKHGHLRAKPSMQRFVSNYAPLVLVSVLLNLMTLLDRSYGTLVMSVGAASMMYADRLIEISRALVGRTIAMVLLPELGTGASKGEGSEAQDEAADKDTTIVARSLSVVTVITMPMALAFMLFGESLAHWIFLTKLELKDLELMGGALVGLSPCAVLFAIVWVVDRVFASRGWSKYFLRFVALGLACNWGLKAAMSGVSLLWVGLGSSFGLLVTVLLAVSHLHRNLRPGALRSYYVDVAGALFCFTTAMVCAYLLQQMLQGAGWHPIGQSAACVLGAGIGLLAHWALDFPFWSLLPQRFRSPLRRRA